MTFSYYARWLAASAFVIAAAPALADVYRCQQASGGVAYQDTPCATGTQKKIDSPASGAPKVAASSAPPDYKLQRADLEQRSLIKDAISSGVPMVSMTRAELNEAMGRPDKVNSGQYGSTFQDQLIYSRRGRTLYVYTKDGVVTSIQNTEGGAPATQRGKQCPSANDIRRIEMDMSNYHKRDDRELQKELQKRLADARECQCENGSVLATNCKGKN